MIKTLLTLLLLLAGVLATYLLATGFFVASEESVTIAAVGDIASCKVETDEEVAAQVEEMAPDTLLTLGDTVYPYGSEARFSKCYDPAWGRFKDITKPSMGNHDFTDPAVGEHDFTGTVDASSYLDYFGVDNYYSYNLGDWHLISLNSNCYVVECGPGSEQFEWLREDLEATDAGCVLAYWHHPAYEAGEHQDMDKMRPMLRMLYKEGADVVLNGHDHIFDRRTRVNAFDSPDPNGIRQFVVGTGGRGNQDVGEDPNTELQAATFGALKMTLKETGYSWEFVSTDGSFSDAGEEECRN